MNIAPITLFVYNRPWHTKQTVEALKENSLARKSKLYVFSDGPRTNADRESIKDVRKYLHTIAGFKEIEIIEQNNNLGLSRSILNGVTKVVNEHGKLIVLEDDLVSSAYYLEYMNEGLNYYENKEDVISISGYVYPIAINVPDTFFLRGADCWGWGTWKRGWDLFESDGGKLLVELKERKLVKDFTYNHSYPYFKILKDAVKGKNDSWAIKWYASAFLKNKLTLYPAKSLIKNIGADSSGTHMKIATKMMHIELCNEPVIINSISIIENVDIKVRIGKYFRMLMFNLSLNYIKNKLSIHQYFK